MFLLRAGCLAVCVGVGLGPAVAGAADAVAGRIEGTVRSAETDRPLPGANIVFLETVLGTAASSRGFYFLEGVRAGSYRVEFSHVGYAAETLAVDIRVGETCVADVSLAETTIPLSEVVVSAGKIGQRLAEAPGSVSVLERETLEERAAISIEEVLPMVSGVDLRFGQVSIRGSTGFNRGAGSRVLLLIDGIPAITGDTGGINWDALPLWEVERVEVVKGASSALYGSNALGGVINIITRAPSHRPGGRIAFHGGWYSRPRYPEWRWTSGRQYISGIDGVYSARARRVGVVMGVAERHSQGYRQNNEDRRWRATARVESELSPRLRADLYAWAAREAYGYFQEWRGQDYALQVRPDSRGDRVVSDKVNLAGELSWTPDARTVVVLRPAWYRTEWDDYFHDGDHFSNASRFWWEARVHRAAGERHTLVSGLELETSRLESSLFGDRRARGLSAYVQDEVGLTGRFRVALGARWDGSYVRDGRDETQLSPKLAAVWRPSRWMSLRMSLARGFRAPSLAERFTRATVGGIGIVPNPDLGAESVWSSEVGCLVALGRRATLQAAVFENRYRDLVQIERDPAAAAFRFANTHRARVRGLDLEMGARLADRLSGRLAYCYQDPVNRDTGEPLMYRPNHSLAAALDVEIGSLRLGGDFRYQSRIDTVAAYPQDERVPLYLVNLRSSLAVGSVTLTFRVENLLQYHFAPIERNLAPIRSYLAGLSVRL